MAVTRRRLRGTAAVGAAAALVASSLLGGSAAAVPGRATLAADRYPAAPAPLLPPSRCDENDGTPLKDTPYATGLPVIPCLPYAGTRTNRFNDAGSLFDGTTTQVVVPKVTIALQAAVGRVFYTVCNGTSEQPCPQGFDVELPRPEFPGYFGVVASVYIQSPLGSSPQYGSFAPVTVSTTAFGAVPVTARVTVRQAQSGGVVRPLQLVWGSAGNVPAGTTFGGPLAVYGPAPSYPDDALATLFPVAHVTGPVTITLDQVTVDRVPLDVGTACTASTDLDLTAPGGWVNGNTYVPTRGQAGAYNPFTTPSYLTSQVDIPAFQGCRGTDGQDLDPLVTGLVAGPGNRLDVTQTVPLSPFACLPADADQDTCFQEHPPTVDPRAVGVSGG